MDGDDLVILQARFHYSCVRPITAGALFFVGPDQVLLQVAGQSNCQERLARPNQKPSIAEVGVPLPESAAPNAT